MQKLILLFTISLLTACSSTDSGMKYYNKSPRGITILNVYKESHSQAYQDAEKHCAKYSKVPRKRESANYNEKKAMLVFECIRPN